MNAAILERPARNALTPDRRWRASPRLALLVGCIAAAALARQLADPSAPSHFEPDLVTLLRGMAAIKTLMVAAAIGLLAWRFGRPVTKRITWAYLIGTWLVTGATTMIWQLSSIVPASVLFHAGLVTLLLAAWRDEAPFLPQFAARRRRAR